MKEISVSDITMKEAARSGDFSLSFKEKIELAKLLDRLNVSVIEVSPIENVKTDSLLIKSLAAVVEKATLAVPVLLTEKSVDLAYEAVKEAKKFRLQIRVPVSSVQMEYVCHQKPEEILTAIHNTVTYAASRCDEVEFMAYDATRAEKEFLGEALTTAIKAGAKVVTVCDNAGTMLPDEFAVFLDQLKADIPLLSEVRLGVYCANDLALADSVAVAAIRHGVSEVKTVSYGDVTASLENVAKIVAAKGAAFDVTCAIRQTELQRILSQIVWICSTTRSKKSPFDYGVREEENEIAALSIHDELPAVLEVVKKLGYELSEEDGARVYEAFLRIAAKKESVGSKEMEAIVASAALQVPPAYRVESYVINSGNIITATAHIKLWKDDQLLEGISTGDGPVDAAFLAIEQIIGHHYELDDFQIQAVTEGREAMGETIVKLRDHGKLYSGRGISTDIIGAGIRAYVSALNKIVYEEAEV